MKCRFCGQEFGEKRGVKGRLAVHRKYCGPSKKEAEDYDTVQELFEDNYHDPKQALQHESRADNKTTAEEDVAKKE